MNEQTKLRALPRRQRIIRRPRLTRLLDEAAERCRILMLIAPAGYGKTTLAREWVEQSGRPYGWYSAGLASADIAAVAAGLATAAGSVMADAGRRLLVRLQTTASPENEVVALARLLAAELSAWPEDAWLVLDDYQLVGGTAERFVIALVEESPVNLLVATRHKPTWATSKRFLYGDVTALDQEALAMIQTEVEAVVGKSRAADVELLASLAQGWPAVVGLAAITEGSIPSTVPERLYEYLADEVLNTLSQRTRDALPDLALIGQVDDVAQETLGYEAAAAVAEELADAGLLQPGESRGRGPLHPLMRAFLKTTLLELPRGVRARKVEGVLDIYITRKQWDAAFEAIREFHLFRRLPDLLVTALPELLVAGRVQTIERWIALANESQMAHPFVDLAAAELATRKGEHSRGLMLASRALERLGEQDPLLSHAFNVAAHAAHFAGATYAETLERATQALAHATDEGERREALWRLFCVQSDSEDPGAADTLASVEAFPPRNEDDLVQVASGHAQLAFRMGNISKAKEAAKHAYRVIDRVRDPLIRTSFCNAYGLILCASASYEEAFEVVDREVADATDYGLDFVKQHARAVRCTADIGLRNFVRARQEAMRMLDGESDDPHIAAFAHGVLARLLIIEDRLDEAVDTLDVAPHPGMDGTLAELITYRALIDAARGASDAALAHAEHAERLSRLNEIRVLAACVRAISALNEGVDEAPYLVETAVQLIRHTGWVDRFITAYRAAPVLLEAVAANPSWAHLVRRAVTSGRDLHLARRLGLSRSQRPAASLTPREREVLGLIADGLTNEQIARRLSISLATVKVHVRHIFEKLGVKSRTQAAVRASALGES